MWIRIFPDKPITKKPAETRMGKGKGNTGGWVAVVNQGRVMFEIEGIPEDLAKKALALAAAKLPVNNRVREARGDLWPSKPTEIGEMSVEDLKAKIEQADPGAVQPPLPLRPPSRSRASSFSSSIDHRLVRLAAERARPGAGPHRFGRAAGDRRRVPAGGIPRRPRTAGSRDVFGKLLVEL